MLSLLGLIVLMHIGASVSGMYWNTEGLFQELHIDRVFHAIGGFWIGAVFFYYAFRRRDIFDVAAHRVIAGIIVLSITALAGVVWEFFEFSLDIQFASVPYAIRQQWGLSDTIFDLVFDLVGSFGAALAYLTVAPRRPSL
jgi:hypothetical protein